MATTRESGDRVLEARIMEEETEKKAPDTADIEEEQNDDKPESNLDETPVTWKDLVSCLILTSRDSFIKCIEPELKPFLQSRCTLLGQK